MSSAVATEELLRVENLNTYYGDSHILKGLSLTIRQGETVALLGRNGVGKTTTLKSIVGWVPPRSGKISFRGVGVIGRLEQLDYWDGEGL